ncbi:MAG TPA: polyamine ABC transporter substrate-binding protein [Stellaceae bacterium]|nr:polyamine ABC transporter substrate-binding protein [Stellaceae bacterium]
MSLRRLAAAALLVAAAALPLHGALAEKDNRLNFYNWSDYIAKDTIPEFEKATGIVVQSSYYDGNEMLDAKLREGRSGYDVVVPSATPFMAVQIGAGVYRPLDKAKLPNLKNLDPQILALVADAADPGNTYGVPYLWSFTGIGYNVAALRQALGDDAPRDSLALLFDPANASRLAACGIEVLDTPEEVFPAALSYLGRDPTSRDLADLAAAEAVVAKVRPYIRKFHSSQYINDLAGGDICLALGYSGDVVQARRRAAEAKNGVDVAFVVPREGAQMAVDMLAIPADAPHPENALAFIDFILRPEIIAKISNEVDYPNPNLAATPLVDADIRGDPAIYPPEAIRERLHIDPAASQEYERARTRAWIRVKSGC